MTSKTSLRDWWKKQYPRDEAEKKRRARAVQELLIRSEVFLEAPVVALYAALPWEIDLKPLWIKRPEACVFPRALPLTHELEFYRIGEWSDLKPGYGGILEPHVSPGFKVSADQKNALILVPGMAFSLEGGRVGSGKGFYDRYLSSLSAGVVRWGICHNEQLLQEKFPLEETDVKMHAIITEEGFHPVEA